MKKSDIRPMPEHLGAYIHQVDDIELSAAFENSIRQLESLDRDLLTMLKGKSYLPGKWTVNDIMQHLTDVERIFTAGVLRFARNQSSHVIDFDEKEVAKNSKAGSRTVAQLMDELMSVRQSTILLYQSFDEEDLLKTGITGRFPISVLAMGFVIIGHQRHHLKVIEERYFPLVEKIRFSREAI